MSRPILEVRNLSKRYRLGAFGARSLREEIERWRERRRNPDAAPASKSDFWALQDVSFDVMPGDVVGVIGRNGAGKSTLLKLLSRITTPTSGTITLRGRVASLLEVGTGFHPELSGRENIFLNGAILGMKKWEIQKKFDEIVDFAEVEKFIDTPVKRYSSGMYVRLAFAVAAHLDPEILIVDEVLAVGDQAFQKKCLGKMGEVSKKEGRTVLFVSHNMMSVKNLCSTGVLLKAGQVLVAGPIDTCLRDYTNENGFQSADQWSLSEVTEEQDLVFTQAKLHFDEINDPKRLMLKCNLRSIRMHKSAFLAVNIHDGLGNVFMQAIPILKPYIPYNTEPQEVCMELDLPPLVPDVYGVSFWVGSHNTETLDKTPIVLGFEICSSPTPERTFPHTRNWGSIVPESRVIRMNVAATTFNS